jgi:mono/diheme cytochrome c family protein
MMRHFVVAGLMVAVLGSGAFAAESGRASERPQMPMMQGRMMGGGQMPMMRGGMGGMMAAGRIAAWDGNIYLLRDGRLERLNSKLEVVASVELPKPEMPMGGRGMMGGRQTIWHAPASAANTKNPVEADRHSVAAGRRLFSQYCATCHGMNGRGAGAVPDLAAPDVQKQSDGELFWKIANGRPPMPAYNSMLTINQGWDLVNYIRSLPSAASSPQGPEDGTRGGGMMGHGMMGGMMGHGMMGSGMMGDHTTGRGMMGDDMVDRGMMGGMVGRRGMMMWGGQVAADSKDVYVLAGGRLTVYNHDLQEQRSKALSEIAPKEKGE